MSWKKIPECTIKQPASQYWSHPGNSTSKQVISDWIFLLSLLTFVPSHAIQIALKHSRRWSNIAQKKQTQFHSEQKQTAVATPPRYFHVLQNNFMLQWMEANVAAVSNVSDPVMRGSGGAVLRDLVNVEEQLSDGCQHISSRIMADTRAGVRPGRTAQTLGGCCEFNTEYKIQSQIVTQTVVLLQYYGYKKGEKQLFVPLLLTVTLQFWL